MKIVCDSCATKYSIADEKVRGKVFKIRCKKCQHIIVVRGAPASEEAVAEPQPAPQAPPADEGVWHVVIGRDQVGPMTDDEIRERFDRGEIDGQTYTWREGLADWLRLGAIDEFRDLATAPTDGGEVSSPAVDPVAQQPPWAAQDEPAAQQEPAQEEAAQDGWGDTRRAEADALADAAPDTSGPDLFASSAGLHNSPVAEEPVEAAPAAAAAFSAPSPSQQLFPEEGLDDSDEPVQLTGQRREESVLFSLNNLQSLAMGKKPAYSPASSLVPEEDDAAGSGLIDIRALAAEQQMVSHMPAGDDLAPIPAVAAANVLMPSGSGADRPWLVPLLGVMGVLLLGAVGTVVYLMSQDSPTPRAAREVAVNTPSKSTDNQVVENVGTKATSPATKNVALQPAKKADTAKPVATEKTPPPKTAAPVTPPPSKVKAAVAPTPTKVAVAPKKAKATRAKSRTTRRSRARKARVKPRAPKVTVVETRPKKPKRRAKKDSSLDALIEGAIKKKGKKSSRPRAAAKPASGKKLPASLERKDIQAGFRRIRGRVTACFDKYKVPGLVMANTTIAGTGRVSAVKITGKFKGTPTGRCVASAVRTARFAKFSGVPMKIPYPYSFR